MQTRLHPFVQDVHNLDMILSDVIKDDVAIEMKAEQISGHFGPDASLVRADCQVVETFVRFSEVLFL